MIRLAPALLLLAMVSGCDRPAAADSIAGAIPSRRAATPRPAPAAANAGKAVALDETTALLHFAYAWPPAANAVPALRKRLSDDARTSRRHALNAARADRADRPADAPFNRHELTKEWVVAGEAGGLLSLQATDENFTGGAHGMRWFEGILWDRAADRDIAVLSLFADRKAALAELVRAFCPALNAERSKRRGEPVETKPGAEWDTACPDLTKQVLVPTSARDGAFHTILVLIAPYEAGSYAEGTYEIALPVTPALVRLLAPARAGLLAP